MPKVTCMECQGTGLKMPLCDGPCPHCDGSGNVDKVYKKKPKRPELPDTPDGRLVDQLCEKDRLSDWETDFCVSVEKWVLAGKDLTDKQQKKIKEILSR